MDLFLFAQIVGCIALFISVSIFQVNKRETMLHLGMIASAVYAIHFLLLGAFTGSSMNMLASLRSYTFFKIIPNKRHVWVLICFILTALGFTYITWEGAISLLPFVGFTFSGIALWHTKPKSIRRWALVVPILWFTYNFISGSYPGMVIEVIMFCSNLIGEYRFDLNHPKHLRRRLAKPA